MMMLLLRRVAESGTHDPVRHQLNELTPNDVIEVVNVFGIVLGRDVLAYLKVSDRELVENELF